MRLLAGIRDQLEKLRTADEKSRAELKVYYERALKGSVGAEQAVLASQENESAAMETLRFRILSLRRYLTDTSRLEDPEAHQLLETAVNIAVGYIAGYQNLRDQLAGFAAEQRASGKILRARPVKGEIDHGALSREFMARFPRIRAALAK